MPTIYLRLIDEPVDTWRPVQAEHADGGFLITGLRPADEKWEFEPCDARRPARSRGAERSGPVRRLLLPRGMRSHRAHPKGALGVILLGCIACTAARSPAERDDPCEGGWRAFSKGDTSAAIVRYSECEAATEVRKQPRQEADAGLREFFAEQEAKDAAEREAQRRRDCPRSTMIDEAIQGLDSLARHDAPAYRHFMAMSCHDAVAGRSPIERDIHPCALLERPPRPAEVSVLRAKLERHAPPTCSAEGQRDMFIRQDPGWNCAPYGEQDKPFLP